MVTTPLQWLGPQTINGSSDVENFSDVVQLSNGNILVVYSTTNPAGVGSPSGADIMGQIFDPLGATIGPAIRLNIITSREEITPAVTALEGGGFAVTYNALSVSAGIPPSIDTNIEVEVYSDTGTHLRGASVFNGVANDIQSTPQIISSTSTNALIFWEDSNEDVVGRLYNPSNNTFGSQFTIFNGASGTGESIRGISGTALSDGSFVVVFGNENASTNDSVQMRFISSTGTLTNFITVADSLAENFDPQVTELTNGRIAVSWTADGSGGTNTGVRVQVFNANGTPFSGQLTPPTTVAGNQIDSTVVAIEGGGFVVFWVDEDTISLRGQRYAANAGAIGGEFIVEDFVASPISNPQATLMEDGRIAITYSFDLNGSNDEVAYAIWDPRDIANAPDSNGRVIGTTQNDQIEVGAGATRIHGHSGNDTITVNPAEVDPAIVFDGGSGTDILALAGVSGTFNFGGETITSIETLRFNGPAVPFGVASREAIFFASQIGGIGTFAFSTASSTFDTLTINMGATTTLDLSGKTVTGFSGIGNLFAQDRIVIAGDGAAETITGTTVDDEIRGGGGNDTLDGHDGDDTIEGGSGADSMTGGAGTNTLSYESSAAAVTVNLGGSASGGDATGDSFSGFQNLTGSDAGNDTLTGDSGANVISGLGGADAIVGENGADTIYGGDGNDAINGGFSIDIVYGGAGDDEFFMSGGDFTDDVYGGADIDTLNVSGIDFGNFQGFDINLVDGTSIKLGGSDGTRTIQSIERIIGSSQADRIIGDAADNAFYGSAGNDTLDGGTGNDTLSGGLGDDEFFVDSYGDQVSEIAGQGTDTILTALSAYSIFSNANVENITATGGAATLTGNTGANTLRGTAQNDRLNGSGGDDTLIGNAGNDTLDGGTGTNRLDGGTGDDTYVVTSFTDVLVEGAGQGTDTVETALGAFSIFTKANIENLTSTTAASVTLTGNSLDNVLTGNDAGNDTLIGSSGNDTLDGRGGADSMDGGTGDDLYIVDSYGDIVSEGVGNGLDEIQTALSAYSIFSNVNVENLTGTSNSGQTLTGNTADNDLVGGQGNDYLIGSGGNDTLDGNQGNDTLEGGSGTNELEGGAGDDTYIVSSFTDVLIEQVGGGIDTVETALGGFSIFSKANIENITALSAAGIGLTGNTENNVLTGNTGNDTINGHTGNDTMIGGAGNDSYTVDSYGDVVTENAGQGTDTILTGLAAYSIFSNTNVENLTSTSATGATLTGNTGNNVLTGGGGADNLIGSGGNDTLVGNSGADTLDGGSGNDTMTGGSGADVFLFSATIGAGNVETITDFSVADDTMHLNDAAFAGIGALGALGGSRFTTGSSATTAAQRVIYNAATGDLFFDADGSGAGAQVLFGHLDSGLALTSADFLVV